jgi:uncharacterized coiled-coil protein SlyX
MSKRQLGPERLAALEAGIAATRGAAAELRAALALQSTEIAALRGMAAAFQNSLRALELAATDDRAAEIRRLLDQLTLVGRERDRQAEEIERLRAEIKGLRRKLGEAEARA